MAEGIENAPPVDQSQPAGSAELAAHMAIALGGNMIPAAAVVTPEAAAQQAAAAATPTDPFNLFKEKFGWEAPEAGIQEVEQLRAFKAAPPVAEYKFANADSERLIKAIDSGDLKSVHAILDQQIRIDNLTTAELNDTTAAEVVKLGMSLKYKDLTPKEIDYKFNKQFSIPPQPKQAADEEPEDYQERLSQWESVKNDKVMDLMIEAKLAKPEIQASKSKLVFPEIGQNVEPEYLEWKKAVQERDALQAQTNEAYKDFTPKVLETKLNFNDEANKIAFEFQYEPDQGSFAETLKATEDENAFWKKFDNSDGTPNRQKFLKAIHFALNADTILLEAMKQAKNATIKASLPDNSQGGGLIRQMVTGVGEPSELDKAMERAGIRK